MGSSWLLVAPYSKLNIFKLKWFSVQFRLVSDSGKFPCADMAEVLIVSLGFSRLGLAVFYFRVSFGKLVLDAEMAST